jgi:hypothetical protein
MTLRLFAGLLFGLLSAVAGFRQSASAQTPAAPSGNEATSQRAFLDRYCVTCHNDTLRTGDLSLGSSVGAVSAGNADLWEKVERKLRSGAMPPAGARRPDKSTSAAFVASLEASLDRVWATHPNPGRPMALHRLNRTEYFNAIRDLFDVTLTAEDSSLLPPDDTSYGFDNIADVLGVSPLLLERYLSIARRVTRAALGPSLPGDVDVHTHYVDFGLSQRQWTEKLPFGTRGGAVFTHQFPVEGEYAISIRLQRSAEAIIGLNRPRKGDPIQRQRIEIAVDGSPVALFTIGFDKTVREPASATPEAVTTAEEPPKELTAEELNERRVRGDARLEARIPIQAGEKRISAAFLANFVPVAGQLREPYASGTGAPPRPMGIDSISITGPYTTKPSGDSPSRRRIFVCRPRSNADEAPCARTILGTVARRAYRRPVGSEELKDLLAAYRQGRKEGDFETGIGMALRRMLMDPAFLFRVERDPERIAPNTPYLLTDLELASRLSFFLWSSIPDEELLTAGERGELKDPSVLERQVGRMLADRRAHSLVKNFAAQWLSLRAVAGTRPDPILFSDFDESLRRAFERQTELLLEAVLLGNRSVLELLDANYTFVNERLARHYGIPGVYGDHFRRVALTDGLRGGLLGQGGILTATAFPNRTSPVLRGKWILENILGSPPPPPPAVVPPLPEAGTESGAVLSMRERLSQHRSDPACASCHARMDPLGFALENFDATGKWRTIESHGPTDLSRQRIDTSGHLTDGTKFDDLAGFRSALRQYDGEFVYTMTEKLLTYALGRGLEPYDAPAIRKAVRDAKAVDYRFSALVMRIVKSLPFQMRMSPDPQPSQ